MLPRDTATLAVFDAATLCHRRHVVARPLRFPRQQAAPATVTKSCRRRRGFRRRQAALDMRATLASDVMHGSRRSTPSRFGIGRWRREWRRWRAVLFSRRRLAVSRRRDFRGRWTSRLITRRDARTVIVLFITNSPGRAPPRYCLAAARPAEAHRA